MSRPVSSLSEDTRPSSTEGTLPAASCCNVCFPVLVPVVNQPLLVDCGFQAKVSIMDMLFSAGVMSQHRAQSRRKMVLSVQVSA